MILTFKSGTASVTIRMKTSENEQVLLSCDPVYKVA